MTEISGETIERMRQERAALDDAIARSFPKADAIQRAAIAELIQDLGISLRSAKHLVETLQGAV